MIDIFLYIFHLLLPLFIAIFIHFLLEPFIRYMSSDRLDRRIVVIHLYVSFSLLILVICYGVAPYIFDQCLHFYHEYEQGTLQIHPLLTTIYDFFKQYNILDDVMQLLNGWTQSFIYWIGHFVLALGISFYLSYDNMHITENIISYLPFHKQGLCMQTLKRLQLMTYQFMKSMYLDFILFFALCLIAFMFIDMTYLIWIALFLALTNLIPYIGPYIGGIPVVVYEYIQDPELGYITFFVVIVLQYIESSYLQPYLFSKSIKLHPIILFLALTFFGDCFGLIGMIFSPLFVSYVIMIIKLLKKLDIIKSMKQIIYKIPLH